MHNGTCRADDRRVTGRRRRPSGNVQVMCGHLGKGACLQLQGSHAGTVSGTLSLWPQEGTSQCRHCLVSDANGIFYHFMEMHELRRPVGTLCWPSQAGHRPA